MTNSSKRRRMKRLLRQVISFGTITLVMLIVVCYGVSARAGRSEIKTVIVKPGDTLWAIASQHGDENGDIREFIYNIKRLNGLPSSAVSPGQELKIPIK